MKVGLIPVNIGVPGIEPMLAFAEKAEQSASSRSGRSST